MAETITAVDAHKDPNRAEQVGVAIEGCGLILIICVQYISAVKERAAFVHFSNGNFVQAENLYLESNIDPRKVCVCVWLLRVWVLVCMW